jgi:hypothetical protein
MIYRLGRSLIAVGTAIMIFSAHSALFCKNAKAGLGESEASVDQDRQALSGQRNASVAHPQYTVHEIVNGAVTVHEYAQNGVVFGVAWKGVAAPDLSSLLGNYYSEFQDASKQAVRQKGQRAHSMVQGAHVVVERSGHMRAIQGKAYVLALLPQGVSADDIQ